MCSTEVQNPAFGPDGLAGPLPSLLRKAFGGGWLHAEHPQGSQAGPGVQGDPR